VLDRGISLATLETGMTVTQPPASVSKRPKWRQPRWQIGGITVLGIVISGCPPPDYQRDWILRKGDYPTATFYGFGSDEESRAVVAEQFNAEIGPYASIWNCVPKRTWLEVLSGRNP
jgi:hypothetical protein